MPRGARATGYGAAGGRRDTAARSAKQASRRARRQADPRVKAAMEETRKAQEELDAQIAAEAVNPALGPAEGALLKQKLEEAQARQLELEREAEEVEEFTPLEEQLIGFLTNEGDGGIWESLDKSNAIEVAKPLAAFIEREILPTSPAKVYVPFDINSIPAKQEGTGWVLGSARQMLIKGHSLSHVVEATGWGKDWFSDIPVDEDGYGLGTEAWLESLDKKEKGEGLSK